MLQELYELLKIAAITTGFLSPVTVWVWRISSRVQRLETKSSQYPTSTDLQDLRITIEKLNGTFSAMEVQNSALEKNAVRQEKILSRLQDHLINNKEGK